ncbi:MAG: flagellar hook-basal body protein [Candidatus Poribacteria bacterium]|nr:flagellar hook-basal body protein [Candidatus Poribacteria bacterium]
MIKGIYQAAQGMVYESLRIDIHANNLANVNSTGYKKSRLQVTSAFDAHYNMYLQNYLETKPSASPYDLPELMLARYNIDFEGGNIRETGNNLDIAINGKGFFGLQHTDGSVVYTRDGAFKMDGKGNLRNHQNLPVLDAYGSPIQLPLQAKRFELTPTGGIVADGREVASLMIVNFQEPYPLSKIGGNLFERNDPNAQPTPVDFQAEDVQLLQGFLENSNVNTIHEMVQMIETLRNFEAYQRILRNFDETVQQINEAGKV